MNVYNQVGDVCTEGGPLLIGDYTILRTWNGIENSDYENLISILGEDDVLYRVSGQSVAVWEPEGGASVSIHQSEDSIMLIKSYEELFENNKYAQYSDKNMDIKNAVNIGNIQIESGVLLVLYSTESGVLSIPIENKNIVTRLKGDFAFETSTLAIPVSNGAYFCVSDYIYGRDNLYMAKRMKITKVC